MIQTCTRTRLAVKPDTSNAPTESTVTEVQIGERQEAGIGTAPRTNKIARYAPGVTGEIH